MSAQDLTPAQSEAFERDGYLCLASITDAAEVATMRAACDDLFERQAGFADGDRIELAGGTRRRLPQIVHPEKYAPELVQGEAYRNAQAIALRLLGPDCVATGNHAILKPARIGAATPWHQDEAYWDPRFAHRAISIWIALQPATLDNGCMHFVPGSHLAPVQPHELIDAQSHGLRLRDSASELTSRAVACELPAGGATIHAGRTLHYAGPNTTGEPRRALVFGFGCAPVRLETPNHYPWQRPEWYATAG